MLKSSVKTWNEAAGQTVETNLLNGLARGLNFFSQRAPFWPGYSSRDSKQHEAYVVKTTEVSPIER